MSRLNDLIQELCPNGVEYKTIESISVKICSGGTPNTGNSEYYGGDIPWLRTQEVDFGEILDTEIRITQKGLDNSSAKWIPSNCVIVAMYGATVGKVGINKIPLTTNQACCNIDINPEQALYKYVFHCLYSKYEYIKSLGQGSQTNINAQVVKSIQIPVPPIAVQREIVRILDSFSELTAELKAELTARKQQYEFYRDSLFLAYESNPKKKLIEIADVSRGVRVVKNQLSLNGYYPVFQNCLAPMGYYDKCNCDSNTTYVISAGAAGEVGYCEKKFWAADDCLVFSNLKGVENKFIYYFLFTKKNIIKSNVRKASIPRLSRSVIENLLVPIIPLTEQKKAIILLDRFDKLCNDISEGLPAEIEARQKQYEYYRDKLLSFQDIKEIDYKKQKTLEELIQSYDINGDKT